MEDTLSALSSLMAFHSRPLDALVVPSEDYHQTEYVSARDKRREFDSDFTGSAEYVKHNQWSELHPDLLNKVVDFISSFKDYVRARATCKAWNLKLPKAPKHIRGPWLVLALEEDTFDVETIAQPLRVPHLRMPELNNTLIRGSCFGWLISLGLNDTLKVSNPFTNSHFNLPPISTFPGVASYQPDAREYTMNGGYKFEDLHMQKSYIDKIVFSCSPHHHKEFMAVAIYGEFSNLAFYKFGDDKWTHIPTPYYYDDVTFHEGKFYGVDNEAYLSEFDPKTLLECTVIMPPPDDVSPLCSASHTQYLVWNPDGDLLLLIRHWKPYRHPKVRNGEEVENCYTTCGFDIYKLNRSEKQWFKESSLGDYVIVVGFNSSIWMQPFCDEEGNCVRNCVYFSDNKHETHYSQVIGGHDVGVFNLQDGRINHIFSNFDFLYPPPVWVSHI